MVRDSPSRCVLLKCIQNIRAEPERAGSATEIYNPLRRICDLLEYEVQVLVYPPPPKYPQLLPCLIVPETKVGGFVLGLIEVMGSIRRKTVCH